MILFSRFWNVVAEKILYTEGDIYFLIRCDHGDILTTKCDLKGKSTLKLS